MRQNGHSNCRAAPFELLIVDPITQHDEKSDQQFSSRGDLGDRLCAPVRQSFIKCFELAVIAGGDVHRLSEQVSEHGTASLANRTRAHLSGARSFQRIESRVGDRFLAGRKSSDVTQGVDDDQCAQGADTFVREQQPDLSIACGFFFEPLLDDLYSSAQIVEQFKKLTALEALCFGEISRHQSETRPLGLNAPFGKSRRMRQSLQPVTNLRPMFNQLMPEPKLFQNRLAFRRAPPQAWKLAF